MKSLCFAAARRPATSESGRLQVFCCARTMAWGSVSSCSSWGFCHLTCKVLDLICDPPAEIPWCTYGGTPRTVRNMQTGEESGLKAAAAARGCPARRAAPGRCRPAPGRSRRSPGRPPKRTTGRPIPRKKRLGKGAGFDPNRLSSKEGWIAIRQREVLESLNPGFLPCGPGSRQPRARGFARRGLAAGPELPES